MKLAEHTVLITGGASGIGLALARTLTRMDNKVIVVGRDRGKLADAQENIPGLTALSCDIGSEEQRESLVSLLERDYPRLSVLVNNAGIQCHSRFDSAPPSLETIAREVEINFIAAVRLDAMLLPLLRQQKEAALIHISSGLSIAPKADAPVYCATKAALSSFARALRYQLEHTPVRVFDVLAPLVDTAMTEGRGRGKISPEAFASRLVAGLAGDRYTMRIGKTRLLYALHRLAPGLAYRIMKDGL
ncbi:SDR family NAD(P)-dependent oxidoreductase [Paenibacillus hemerocallicola]|uniref:SDR family NAD(P)-dependent oxidoreductase n=1 Tax=Paenibacillus hemerocallicola TaxID=1172614 RepID=A0A5C4T8S7_9BACL|nr:SDR family NAD(P)-dependent oxidoreductase [Paenibacillus hemerocallicola]TNJ65493.1 SDR family NAD(P)-dependent oxidoreductase [Paenibacillus hemerocallicola]